MILPPTAATALVAVVDDTDATVGTVEEGSPPHPAAKTTINTVATDNLDLTITCLPTYLPGLTCGNPYPLTTNTTPLTDTPEHHHKISQGGLSPRRDTTPKNRAAQLLKTERPMTDIIPISVIARPVRRLYLGQGPLHSCVKTAEYPSTAKESVRQLLLL